MSTEIQKQLKGDAILGATLGLLPVRRSDNTEDEQAVRRLAEGRTLSTSETLERLYEHRGHQECRSCGSLFPYDPDADICKACLAADGVTDDDIANHKAMDESGLRDRELIEAAKDALASLGRFEAGLLALIADREATHV